MSKEFRRKGTFETTPAPPLGKEGNWRGWKTPFNPLILRQKKEK